MNNFKDLKVYMKSYESAKKIYGLSEKFPEEERYGMTSQIRRASVSIPLNIAEGYGKAVGGRELIRYLSMARGSCAEIEVLLNFSLDFGFIDEAEARELLCEYDQIGKMLTGLIKSILLNEENR